MCRHVVGALFVVAVARAAWGLEISGLLHDANVVRRCVLAECGYELAALR